MRRLHSFAGLAGGLLERVDLGVGLAGADMPAFTADAFALGDHATDHRIGLGGVGAAFGQAQRARHHRVVGGAVLAHPA